MKRAHTRRDLPLVLPALAPVPGVSLPDLVFDNDVDLD